MSGTLAAPGQAFPTIGPATPQQPLNWLAQQNTNPAGFMVAARQFQQQQQQRQAAAAEAAGAPPPPVAQAAGASPGAFNAATGQPGGPTVNPVTGAQQFNLKDARREAARKAIEERNPVLAGRHARKVAHFRGGEGQPDPEAERPTGADVERGIRAATVGPVGSDRQPPPGAQPIPSGGRRVRLPAIHQADGGPGHGPFWRDGSHEPGNSPRYAALLREAEAVLAKFGVNPAQVVALVATHYHGDGRRKR
jgi:hypothetical protein